MEFAANLWELLVDFNAFWQMFINRQLNFADWSQLEANFGKILVALRQTEFHRNHFAHPYYILVIFSTFLG